MLTFPTLSYHSTGGGIVYSNTKNHGLPEHYIMYMYIYIAIVDSSFTKSKVDGAHLKCRDKNN